jgi:hypothetical protein
MNQVVVNVHKGRSPGIVPVPGLEVYQYFHIESDRRSDIRQATMQFKVSRRWAAKHKDISFFEFERNKWVKMPIEEISHDKRWVYLKAVVGDIGDFALAAEKKEKEYKMGPLWAIFGIVVLALLAVSLFGLYVADADFNGIPKQVWTQDTVHTINLSKYFVDPDGESLRFSATGSNNIEVFFDRDGRAVLTPTQGWSGSDSITFSAQDSAGDTVQSNTVDLVVRPSYIPVDSIPLLKYALGALLILLVLVMIFQYAKKLANN